MKTRIRNLVLNESGLMWSCIRGGPCGPVLGWDHVVLYEGGTMWSCIRVRPCDPVPGWDHIVPCAPQIPDPEPSPSIRQQHFVNVQEVRS